jgi:hypothetical protein
MGYQKNFLPKNTPDQNDTTSAIPTAEPTIIETIITNSV